MYHLKYLTIMSLNYSIAMMGNPLKKEEPKKAYAKAQTNGELSLKELSTLIASKCTVHQADVSAVLIATTECMLEGLKAGKQVNFGDLGAFRLQINSGGAPSADLFTSDYIKEAYNDEVNAAKKEVQSWNDEALQSDFYTRLRNGVDDETFTILTDYFLDAEDKEEYLGGKE